MSFTLKTPLVYLIFNRPELTQRTWERIAKNKPAELLIVADGPRKNRPGEALKCELTRKIVEKVDWPCKVHRNYVDHNLGCKKRVSSGISWAFTQVEEAIILEDDCLVDDSFFRYSQELLEKYRDDNRIMMISGDRHGATAPLGKASYRFTRWPHIWGWATWRRAWNYYDVDMSEWPRFKAEQRLKNILRNPQLVLKWNKQFQSVYEGKIDTWDFQWDFALLSQGGLSIQPKCNLVTNIGFGPEATHTTKWSRHAESKVESMPFPLNHPTFTVPDDLADELTQRKEASLIYKAVGRLKGLRSK